jgi:hypothetical protein
MRAVGQTTTRGAPFRTTWRVNVMGWLQRLSSWRAYLAAYGHWAASPTRDGAREFRHEQC